MEYIIIENVGTVVGLLSNDILSTVLSDTSSLILSIVNGKYNYGNNLYNLLEELDILYKINILKNIIKKYEKKYEKIKNIKYNLLGIKNIILHIYNILLKILNKIENYNKTYISYIKRVNYNKELKELKKYDKLLEKRFELLLKILNIMK